LWNEPNTPTGDAAGACHPDCPLTPVEVARIIRDGCAAIREHQAAHGNWTGKVIGVVLGSVDMTALDSYYQAGMNHLGGYNIFSCIDAVAVHVYMHDDPATCPDNPSSDPRCINDLGTLRRYLDSHGGSSVHLDITEGGYAGDDTHNSYLGNLRDNTHTVLWATPHAGQADQGTWGRAAIHQIQAHPEWMVDIFSPYNPIDNSDFASQSSYDFWTQSLGASEGPSGTTLRYWGEVYRSVVINGR
jgi:hypothetical protein